MEDGDRIAEAPAETCERLRGKADLRHEHDGTAATRKLVSDGRSDLGDGQIAALLSWPRQDSVPGTANCFALALIPLGVNLWDGRDASLPPWMGLLNLRDGQGARCCPGGGYGFLCFHAFVGWALLWPVRGVIALVNTLLCVLGNSPCRPCGSAGF